MDDNCKMQLDEKCCDVEDSVFLMRRKMFKLKNQISIAANMIDIVNSKFQIAENHDLNDKELIELSEDVIVELERVIKYCEKHKNELQAAINNNVMNSVLK